MCVCVVAAIETVKEEEKQCRSLAAAKATPVLEEFMPIQSKIKEDGGSKVEKDCRDKMNWMSSAQLWSDNNDNINNNNNIKNKSVDDVKEVMKDPIPSRKKKKLIFPFNLNLILMILLFLSRKQRNRNDLQ